MGRIERDEGEKQVEGGGGGGEVGDSILRCVICRHSSGEGQGSFGILPWVIYMNFERRPTIVFHCSRDERDRGSLWGGREAGKGEVGGGM